MKPSSIAIAIGLAFSAGLSASAADGHRSFRLSAFGGALGDSGSSKSPDFGSGFQAGASLSRSFGDRVRLDVRGTFGRAEGRGPGVAGSDFDRISVEAGLSYRLRDGERAVPYLVAAAGATTLSQTVIVRGERFRSNFTKPAFRFGLGLDQRLSGRTAVFVEASGRLYSFDGFGFQNASQVYIGAVAGVSVQIGR